MSSVLPKLLSAGGLIQAPGAYDGLTARLIEAAGFPVVYMTGYGVAASHGLADVGILGRDEMAARLRIICNAVNIPVCADGDTGYGGPNDVAETVRAYEDTGAAAIQLEDQTWPKRCGHMEGKTIVPSSEMIEKIRAATEARSTNDFLIIARTDAIAVEGFEQAIERGHQYAEAGADILFIEAPATLDQLKTIPQELPSRPHIVNIAPRTPQLPPAELQAMGYTLAIYPGINFMATYTACTNALAELKDTGIQANLQDWADRFTDINAFLVSGNQTEPTP